MADEADLFARAVTEEPFASLVADGRPAMVFDRAGRWLLWANAAGAAYLGLRDRADLAAWVLAAGDPLARRIAALYDRLSAGQDRLERLALPHGPLPRLVVSRARRILIEPERGVLLVVVDGGGALAGDPVVAYRRFAGLDAPSETIAPPVAEQAPMAEATAAAEAPGGLPSVAEAPAEAAPVPATEGEPLPAIQAEPVPAPLEPVATPSVVATTPAARAMARGEYAEAIGGEEAFDGADAALAGPLPSDGGAGGDDGAADLPPEALPGFVFPDHGRAVRFVFELDPELVVRFVSDDLAAVVGPAHAAIVGLPWVEVARRLDLDPRGRLARSLVRHDTFTGVTVDWPVEGQALRVPVDLAGMPVFGRNRSFRGYRGFGVAKTGAAFGAPAVVAALAPATEEGEPAGIVPSLDADVAADRPLPAFEAGAGTAMAPTFPGADHVPTTAEPAVPSAPEVSEPAGVETDEERASVAIETPVVDAEPLADAEPVAEESPGEDDELVAPPTAEIIPSPIVPRPVPGEAAEARNRLSKPERDAFDKIAEALAEAFGSRIERPPVADEAGAAEIEAPDTVAPPPSTVETPPAGRPAPVDVALLDKLPVALAVLRDGEVVHANRGFLDLTDYADLAEMRAAGGFAAVFEGSALPREASIPAIRRRDGIEIPVSAKLHAMEWAGAFASLLVVQETAATTSRDRLAHAEQRVEDLEAILDTATDGVLVLDQKGLIIGANRSAEALFGVERAHMIGAALIDHLAPESHRGALDYLDGLARSGLSSVLNDGREVIGRVEGGGLVPLFMTIGRVSLTKYCAVLRDITQWKRAEEELTAAKRSAETASSQKSDFLAKMSHEIRTPLNAIIGFSEVMMEERFGPIGNDRYKEYLRDIHVSGSHIMSLVNDLLDLSKIEAGKLELTFESVGLNDVVRECAALMQPQANRERVIIRTSLSSSLPPVVADSRSLRQIVLNLLSNAVKFNNPGGQVIVSTLYEPSGEVVLRVRDTGEGMSEGDIVKAMEPFRQLNTTRAGQGTGLGLPLTKALVEANRAAFRIDSTPGQGTLVQITFPSTRVLAE